MDISTEKTNLTTSSIQREIMVQDKSWVPEQDVLYDDLKPEIPSRILQATADLTKFKQT